MKKTLFILSLIPLPFVVNAQTTEEPVKVLVEKYQPSDEEIIKLGEKRSAELNREINTNLAKMTKKQKAAMVDSLRKKESKKHKITGNDDKPIEIPDAGDKAIKDYYYRASAPELFVPLTEPELVEVDADTLK